MDRIPFGEHLRNVRKEKGLSIRELARRSGVSNAYISQLENDKTKNPTYEIIGKLAKGLGIATTELVNANDPTLDFFFDGNDLSYLSITEMDGVQREDFGKMFSSNREYNNLTLDEISAKTGIPKEDLVLLEEGKLNRNLTEEESINLLNSFSGFHFSIFPKNVIDDFELGNFILFNDKAHYKGKPINQEMRRELFEAISKVMMKYS